MRKILDRFELSLKMADPVMVTQATIENASNAITGASQNIETYRGSNNEGYLDNANNQLDVVLAQLPLLDKRPSAKTAEASAVILGSVRRSANETLKAIELSIHELATELTATDRKAVEIREEIDRKSQSFTTDMQRFSQRFEEEETGRRKAHKDLLDEMQDDIAVAITTNEERAGDATAKVELSLKDLLDSQTAKAAELLQALESDKASAQNLLGIVGETGLIKGYQKEANSKRNEARFWRGVALVAFGFTAYVGYRVFSPPATGQVVLNWEDLLSRSVLVAVIGLTAAYAAKEASTAGRAEELNRRAELQLASVGPFIAELAADKRQEIREKYVERMYVPMSPELRSDPDKTVATVGQLMLNLLKEIPDILKAGKSG
jgi:hypothetical protein